MRCPFLEEVEVRFCGGAPFHKPIAAPPDASERCLTPAFRDCEWLGRRAVPPDAVRCPLLRETISLSCTATPGVRNIPYSAGLLSRCQSDEHRNCEVYRALAEGSGSTP